MRIVIVRNAHMKKRINLTIDQNVYDWYTSYFSDRNISKTLNQHLISISCSVGEKNMKMNIDEAKMNELSESEAFLESRRKQFEEELGLYQKYANSEDGYPLNLDQETEEKIKRIQNYLNLQDSDLRRKRATALVKTLLDPMFKNIISSTVDMLLREFDLRDKNSTRTAPDFFNYIQTSISNKE